MHAVICQTIAKLHIIPFSCAYVLVYLMTPFQLHKSCGVKYENIWQIGKAMGVSGKVLSLHLCKGTEETLSENRWSLGQELNPGPPKY